MARNAVGWFEIYVQDMERAKVFYESIFKVTLHPLDSGGVDMRAFPGDSANPGASGALVKMPGLPSGGNSALVYFNCDDCATEAGRVANAGGRIQKEKFSIGQHGFIALAYDTEGNMFGLHSMN